MKNLFILLSLCLSMKLMAANEFVVGTVNIQQVITSIKEGKKIRTKLKKEFDKKQNELKTAEGKLKKETEQFQKQRMVMNEKARGKKEQELQARFIEMQQKAQRYQKQMHELENKEKKPILDRLKPIIESVSKAEDVTMTFEVSAAPIVYVKKSTDITDKVIKAYDKKHPGK